MRIYTIDVEDNDCRLIVDRLQCVGRAIDVFLAMKIECALDHDATMVGLVPPERDAILSALDDPPESLVGLRDALSLDHQYRAS
jgi:hypothetical protein